MKLIKLPTKLALAIGLYYLNRDKQYWTQTSSGSSDNCETITLSKSRTKWDKEASIRLISDALPKGWSYQASAGTFWFSRPKGKAITVSESTFPNGKV